MATKYNNGGRGMAQTCDHERTMEVSDVMDGEPAMAIVCYDCTEVLAVCTVTTEIES